MSPKELGRTVEIYATAFPDMHRELYSFYVVGDTVVVELALQGKNKGPLELPIGIIRPTGKKMNAPCCDVFQLTNGKIKSFNCYPSGTVVVLRMLRSVVGLDRVVCGSDYPYFRRDLAVGCMAALKRTEELATSEREAVMGANALTLFPRLADRSASLSGKSPF